MHERLKYFIQHKGWKKKDFADKMGISAQSVNSYLNGNLDIQKLFIKLYDNGCDLNWLVSGAISNNVREHETDLLQLARIYKHSNNSILLRLNTIIKKYNINLDAIAVQFNINPDFITDMLLGKSEFRIEIAYIIADACKFSFTYFVTGIGDEHDLLNDLVKRVNNNQKNNDEILKLTGQIELLKQMLSESRSKSETPNIVYKTLSKHKLASEPKI